MTPPGGGGPGLPSVYTCPRTPDGRSDGANLSATHDKKRTQHVFLADRGEPHGRRGCVVRRDQIAISQVIKILLLLYLAASLCLAFYTVFTDHRRIQGVGEYIGI